MQIGPQMMTLLKKISNSAFPGLILSIVPGLAHFIEGRFREVRWFVLGWLLALLGGIFFYGGTLGFSLLGLAVGLHGWVAFNHSLVREEAEPQKKGLDYMALLVVIGLLYWGIRGTAFRDFTFGYTNLTIPYQNIQSGDLLLARRSAVAGDVPSRGALAIGSFKQLYNNYGPASGRTYVMIGQIVALPGEKIEITGGQFLIDNQPLDAEKFPVPKWLYGQHLSTTIPTDSCFVSIAYNVAGHGVALTDKMIFGVCILQKNDIEAIAVMRWLPVSRRGSLRTGE